ncbi:hypothetical protein JW868_01565 [Candidatus Woesearchaeota archaeon]|nr:hypothetical protein [Candidatus Woesearchaeota archaeon]
MVLNELQKTFESRKHNLINILENQNEGLDLSKQHQLFGAIKEIDNFLRVLEHLREQENNDELNVVLSNQVNEKFKDKLSDLFKK